MDINRVNSCKHKVSSPYKFGFQSIINNGQLIFFMNRKFLLLYVFNIIIKYLSYRSKNISTKHYAHHKKNIIYANS